MATVRKVALFLSLFLIVLVVAVFAYSNPDSLTVDIGFTIGCARWLVMNRLLVFFCCVFAGGRFEPAAA